ncbi:amino acid adenylation domain-containing protein [Micromonospora aurantiaca (nom. illeg.)]|uniref:amino acid adenylation domain-containing protein n=1 Tax=Micromonospora aurantiaca (nom. illeg.) TaxID=47850 RepID=UPI003EBAAFF4
MDTQHELTLDRVRADIGAAVGDTEALDASDGDLIACGLDSLKVMRLASRWRAAGVDVKYAELMERPTLAGWMDLLTARQAPAPATAAPAASGAPADDPGEPFDLAPMQYAYWVGRHEQLVLGGVATHFYAEFDGAAIDTARLDAATRALIARHDMLRVTILDDGRQRVADSSPWSGATVHDLRDLDGPAVTARLAEIRDRLSHRRFDIARGEVFDLAVSVLPGGASRLHLNIDMIVADALSFRIILNDLAELYADPDAALPPIRYSYRRYLAERRAAPARGREAAVAYWRERLPEMPAAPQVPLATAPERLAVHRVVRRFHRLDAAWRERLDERARTHGVTSSMVFAAAFTEVLSAWSTEPDFLLNVPLFDRDPLHPDVAHLVGDFTNLLIVAVHTGEGTFLDACRRLQDRVRADALHSDFSGLEVLRALSAERGAQALAPVVFTSALGLGELFSRKVRDCFGDAGWNISQAPQVWLDHQVTEDDGGLLLNWDAVDGLIPADVLDDMFAAYLWLLDRIVTDPQAWTEPVPSLLPEAAARRRAALNDTAGPQRRTTLTEGFLAHAAAEPDRIALLAAGAVVRYGDLAERARRIAGRLVAAGLDPGDTVAVTLPKGPAQIEAVLGVLCAGGVFAPVGVDLPPVRRAAIHRAAGVRIVLTDTATRDQPIWSHGLPVLAVEEATDAPPLAELRPAGPDDLAYVIHTSGSTGGPKCVEMTHRAAMNTIEDIGDRWGIGPDDRGLALSALDHDWSVYDIFAFLTAGAALVCVDDTARRDAEHWLDLVRRHRVTVWTSVPALLDMLLVAAEGEAAEQAGDLPLRLALVGGDWVGLDLYDRLTARAPGARLVALGGATEVGIHSTWHEVTEVPAHWRSVPYGAPLRNQLTRVADGLGRDRPDLVPGELWLGGVGVGPGYRGDPERTAARFVERDGQRWYRTGDLARFHPDGRLEFLGRLDGQVKILGHRLDLGDVEAALREHPGVARAVALTVPGEAGPRLVAAVTPAAGGPVDAQTLRAYAGERLPPYMVPYRVDVLDTLPLTANAKIDRTALAARFSDDARPAPEAAGRLTGPAELAVAAVWADLLGRPAVGPDDSFFALGGNSLLATRLVTAVRAAGFPGARLSTLFAAPTLRAFVDRLGEASAPVAPAAPATAVPVEAHPERRYDPFDATEVQRAYWLGRRPEFTLGGVGSHWYWEFEGEQVDLERFEEAFNRVVARHDMLRAVFDDDARQRVLPEVPRYRITVTDADGDAYPIAVERMRDDLAHLVHDPAAWPMFAVRAVRSADRTHIGLSLDFLVLDALSIMIVLADLAELYADPAAALPELGITFRDCVVAGDPDPQRREAARRYWVERLPHLPPGPRLPLARDPRQVDRPRFTRREGRLNDQAWSRLVARAAEHGVTPSTVVAAAFAAVLGRWSATPDFTLNLTLFDRPATHPDIPRIVGDFTSLLLVANTPEPGESFAAAVRRLQGRVWADIEHSSFSGIAVLQELARHTGSAEVAMPVVFTSTIGVSAATDRPFGLTTPFGRYVTGLSQTPQVWLDHQVTEHEGGLLFNWDAVEELFAPGVLDAMFDAYRALLRHLATAGWDRPAPVPLPAGQAQVRARVNDTGAPVTDRLLHAGFAAVARDDPGRTALAWGDGETLSYGELARRARRVAGALVATGVRPGDNVAVSLPRGPDQVAAVLGVLHAGAAYVPVAADQPELRRERIHRGAGIRVALTASAVPDGVTALPIARALAAAELAEPVTVTPDQPAYVIFTSGSTGEPKGVVTAHGAAWNTVDDISSRFGVGPGDRVLAVSALDFDLSVYDLFGVLAAGGTVVLTAEDERADPAAWLRLADTHRVTVWNSAPALLDMLLTMAGDRPPLPLRLALVSGDWVGLDLRRRLDAVTSGCRLIALGGATEAAIWSNAFEVTEVPPEWTSVPYGFPLRGQRYRVADPAGADRPDWVPGELWIGGAGVALGYHGDERRTAQRFVRHDGGRWYRTGDLGRYWPDGTLEFLGRADHQVKIRGHRVELGEVEAALESHPAVTRAVAVAPGGRQRRLLAAVVAPGGVDPGDLRAHLARRLPEHMVPTRVEHLAELPLTANGKVDRARVEAIVDRPDHTGGERISDPVEEAVAQLWADLLGQPVTGRRESFFALGGNSLLATRLVAASRARFGVELSLRQLLTAPTVAEQAALVAAQSTVELAVEEGVL